MTQRITFNTPRLLLIGADALLLRAELAGFQAKTHAALAVAIEANVPDKWPPELYDEAAVEWMRQATFALPLASIWRSYYIALKEPTLTLVGVAGYKYAPDAEGVVEIGYSVLASHQRQGIASEAVEALIAQAFAHGARAIAAETYPALVASLGVMRRAGMMTAGAGSENGTVRYLCSAAL